MVSYPQIRNIDLKVNREVYASRGWRIWPKAAKNVHVG